MVKLNNIGTLSNTRMPSYGTHYHVAYVKPTTWMHLDIDIGNTIPPEETETSFYIHTLFLLYYHVLCTYPRRFERFVSRTWQYATSATCYLILEWRKVSPQETFNVLPCTYVCHLLNGFHMPYVFYSHTFDATAKHSFYVIYVYCFWFILFYCICSHVVSQDHIVKQVCWLCLSCLNMF